MSEFAQKIVVALISIVGTALVAVFVFFFYQKPALELSEQQLEQTQQYAVFESKAARDAQDRLNKVQQEWNTARNQFLSQMQEDIQRTLRDQRTREGTSNPSPIDCAQQLVDHRNQARQRTLQISSEVSANMTEVYRNLDSDFDELQALLARQPSSKEIIVLVTKINNGWANKVELISRLAENAMRQTGCPVVLASNR